MSFFDVVSYSDAYPEIGMGHLSRQIELLNQFVIENPGEQIAITGTFSENAKLFAQNQIDKRINLFDNSQKIKSRIAIVDTMFVPQKMVLDNNFFKQLKNNCEKIILLLDPYEITLPKEVDVYINHLPYAKVKKSMENQSIYTGLDYLPVPNRFFNTAKYNLNGNILFVVGSTPSRNYIMELFELIQKNLKGSIQIILSPSMQFEFVNELRSKYKEFDILQNVDDLVYYFNKSSAIVTTYGNTTYQALASKRPIFTFGLVDFQEYYGRKLEEEGYSVNLGHISNLNIDKFKLIQDKSYLSAGQAKLKEKFNQPTIGNVLKIILDNLN